MRFDVIRFLQDNNIPFSKSGKNIGEGWIGVRDCPFCNDKRFHMGVHVATGAYSCWRCGTHGWIYDLVQALLGVDPAEMKRMGKGYFTLDANLLPQRKRKTRPDGTVLEFPKTFQDLTDVYLRYMTERGYDISIAQRYRLRCADLVDNMWKFRIIIPFYIDDCLVSWTGRTIIPNLDPRYKNLSNKESLIDVRTTLFNIDALSKKSILVEGAFDVFRIGGATAAIIGLEYTNAQIAAIKSKGVEECTIIFDGEAGAYKRANELAKALNMMGIDSSVIRLPEGADPGSLSEEDAAEIRRMCL